MSKDRLIQAFDMDIEKCKTCMLTKITKKPFQNVKCETEVLELIHSDICDLHATPSLENKKYFMIFIDDALRRTIDQSDGGKLRDLNAEESCALLEDLALYDNESWNDPRNFAKPVKAIALPQDVPSTSNCRLIELETQVQRLMEAHFAPTQPTQMNKITTSCEICSGPHDTQYCMEDPEQAFVKYASSHTDEARGKWYTFKTGQNNLGDTYISSWKSHPNLRWRQPQNSLNDFSNPPNRFQPNGLIPNRSFNNRPQNFNNQSNIEGLVSEFMASQDARLSKFEADFKRQQGEMTNKIDIVLKAITDRIVGTLPSDTVKNPKLGTHPVSTKENEEEERGSPENHLDSPTPPDPLISFVTEKVLKFNSLFESLRLVPPSPNAELVCTKEEDGDVFIEIIPKDDNSHREGPEARVLIIDPRLSQVVLGRPFIEISNMTHNLPEGVVRFTNENNEVPYKMPHKIEQYNSLSNLEKEHAKSVYLRNEEDKKRGVDYVMSKILGFYKECLELGPEYVTGMDDEGEVT
ncbi:hypothetical protein Tco_0677069 [Tanacetum coccineum]